MDIKIPDSLLRKFLETKASVHQITDNLSLCGPTVDRLEKIGGQFVYEIEAITNRVDSASAFGVAREAAAILPIHELPAKLKNSPYDLSRSPLPVFEGNLKLNVQILDQSLVPHFAAIVLENIEVKPSPKQMQKELELSGQRPINNLVDITNYLTLCYGQPVHIFDFDKIGGATMKVRQSKKGEKLTTLDGKTHVLHGGDIVIEDGSGKLIDLCGIMGGDNSKVDSETKRVVLFVQTYHPKKVRTTSLYTQERTLAAQIFEKHPDPELVIPTLLEGIQLLQDLAGASVASKLIDIYPSKINRQQISLSLDWLNRFVGISIPQIDVLDILVNLGFDPEIVDDTLICTVPTWRSHDITIPEDIVEEVARVYGFYRLPAILPTSTLPQTTTSPLLKIEIDAKKYLADLGFCEVMTSSLISQSMIDKTKLETNNHLKLQNPLSEDYEYLRSSLVPSILQALGNNIGKVDLPIRMMELSNVYLTTKHELPDEVSRLCIVTLGLDWLTTKGYLEALAKHLRVSQMSFVTLDTPVNPFITKRSAQIKIDQESIGTIGEIDPAVLTDFGISDSVYMVDLNFQAIAKLSTPTPIIRSVSKYPPVIEDITIQSDQTVGNIMEKIRSQEKVSEIEYVTTYENKHTFRITFTNSETALTHEDVARIKDRILEATR